jgi:hypothetical protein
LQQIWRILISGNDKLLIETRDINTKDVFYNCFILENGKEIFSNFQLEEKYWIGVEAFDDDVILFHNFPRPDMPNHRGIIALNVLSKNILWKNNEFSFLFVLDGKVYGFKQGFDERYFAAFDFSIGELTEDLGNDFNKINTLRIQSENKKNWGAYIYPKIFSDEENDERIRNVISEEIKNLEIEGEVEYNIAGNILLFNYHIKNAVNNYTNKFSALNLDKGTVVLSEILNENVKSLLADSFFVYKNFMFLLRGKNEIIVYDIK